MADRIALETTIYEVGLTGTPEDKRCCTAGRADEMGAFVHDDRTDNQLITEAAAFSTYDIDIHVRLAVDFERSEAVSGVDHYFYIGYEPKMSYEDSGNYGSVLCAIDLDKYYDNGTTDWTFRKTMTFYGDADRDFYPNGNATLYLYSEGINVLRYEGEIGELGSDGVTSAGSTTYVGDTTTPQKYHCYVYGRDLELRLGDY